MKLKNSLNVLNILNVRVGKMAQLLRVKHMRLVSITHMKLLQLPVTSIPRYSKLSSFPEHPVYM